MNNKIKRIRIENFKRIKRIEFEPKKVNIILGSNNTGKTSILEAIYLILLIIAKGYGIDKIYNLLAQHEIMRIIFDKYFDNKLLFKERKFPPYISIKIDEHNIEVKHDKNIYFNLMLDNSKISGASLLDYIFRFQYNFINIKYCYLNYSIISNIRLENLWGELMENMKDVEVLKFLRKLNPSIRNLLFIKKGDRTLLYYEEEGTGIRLPIDLLGTGFKTYLTFAIITHFSDIILFDDIESGFHYDLIPKFVELINNANTQFFFTTQNKELIEEIIRESDDVLIIYLYKTGEYEIYDKDEAEEILKLRGDIR